MQSKITLFPTCIRHQIYEICVIIRLQYNRRPLFCTIIVHTESFLLPHSTASTKGAAYTALIISHPMTAIVCLNAPYGTLRRGVDFVSLKSVCAERKLILLPLQNWRCLEMLMT